MKRLILVFVVVLLVAGGGGGVWWFFLRADAAPAAGGAVEDEPLRTQRRIDLEPMVLPILREGQVTLHVTVVIAVQLVNPLRPDEAKRLAIPLRDALFSDLHALFALRYVQERGFDIPVVRDRLLLAAERVLGKGEVAYLGIENLNKRNPTAS